MIKGIDESTLVINKYLDKLFSICAFFLQSDLFNLVFWYKALKHILMSLIDQGRNRMEVTKKYLELASTMLALL